jgi:hypothetical protein
MIALCAQLAADPVMSLGLLILRNIRKQIVCMRSKALPRASHSGGEIALLGAHIACVPHLWQRQSFLRLQLLSQ